MAQYKINQEQFRKILRMRDHGATAVVINRPNTDSTVIHINFYSFGTDEMLILHAEDIIFYDDIPMAPTSIIETEELPIFTYNIGGIDVPYINRNNRITQMNNDSGGEMYPLDDRGRNTMQWGLVYFNIGQLIACTRTSEILLTEEYKEYRTLIDSSEAPYDRNTNFTTLEAAGSDPIAQPDKHMGALAPTSGKPCPPFWQMENLQFASKGRVIRHNTYIKKEKLNFPII